MDREPTEPAPGAGVDRPVRRRSPTLAALLLVVAATALWASSRMTWVQVDSADGLGADRVTDLDGGTWAAATTPLALALLAAVAAAFAVRGRAVRIVAGAVALVAVAAAIPVVQLFGSGVDPDAAARVADLPDRATVVATEIFPLPAILAGLGACVALAAAVALWRTPSAQAGLSSKYDAPAARREAAARGAGTDEPLTERTLWDSIDAGHDPTVGDEDDDADNGADEDSGESGTRR
ncbi:TIGR02234 family membrane protein [Rhodococcus sp. F64268]|uniref:TIGR02234 family membrane protein n=1 Tax=Rhodococcus sp. F64268 TaxID=2926402 RepID=UPI001FF186E5|nr:TIGR02234 family membrane protein [Rhodococcus sp. F64268]MCK0092805.1 TIGR02234 family membrane protein [Rhodococcus sp. F64268]